MKQRTAEGMSINLIIVAAIALIILVLISFLITDSSRNLTQGLEACSAKGGVCAPSAGSGEGTPEGVPSGYEEIDNAHCSDGETCYGPPRQT